MMLQLRVKRNMELKMGSGDFAGFSTWCIDKTTTTDLRARGQRAAVVGLSATPARNEEQWALSGGGFKDEAFEAFEAFEAL